MAGYYRVPIASFSGSQTAGQINDGWAEVFTLNGTTFNSDAPAPPGLMTVTWDLTVGIPAPYWTYTQNPLSFLYPVDLDGGTLAGSNAVAPTDGRPTWSPKYLLPLNTRGLTMDPSSLGNRRLRLKWITAKPSPAGAVERRWTSVRDGTTTVLPPRSPLGGVNGPWVTNEATAVTLVVASLWEGPGEATVPLASGAWPITVSAASPDGTPATLVSPGGATDNGDGTLTVPSANGAFCYPTWSTTGGIVMTMRKPAVATWGNVSYGPFWGPPDPTPPPIITKLIPTAGPDTGGTTVDIIGTDLTGASIDFGGTAGTGLTVDPSGGLATVTTPAHTAGPAPVTITTPAGTSNAETFTFEAPIPPGLPTLTGIDPTEGTETGGTLALLTGNNLTGTTGVDFGGTPATIITTTTTAILVTTPPHPAGTVNVTATDGTTTTDPLSFEYVPVVEPTYGPDVIANLVALLAAELGVPVSSRRSPTATKDSDPSVVVRRTGGPSKGVASDNPTVTIEAWAPTTTESFQLLQSARMVVIEAAEQGRAGLRRYDEFAGPADLPDPSTTNPRHTLTASVVTRIE